ncbi:MAG: arginine N-succinyltransferase [Planctomycetota bacterium]|nr:arginine N-succinyltransferase [Planctomycetota bacterium]
MLIVRAAEESDVDQLYDLIQKSAYGLTTLKISKQQLLERVESSTFSFKMKTGKPAGQPYVFVMEDLAFGKVVGTSAIYAKTGGYEPFYSYEIKESLHKSTELSVDKKVRFLDLVEEHNGPTEIGSLFLSPDYWGKGHGKLLSLARFLFMAEYPERFDSETIAEMRGNVTKEGFSPFWNAIGAHFFEIEFPQAETLTTNSKNVIADLFPRHPIYIPLLPDDAQQVIGNVHQNTQPAKKMLEDEGFQHRNLVDIFDGGPVIHCETSTIRCIKASRSLQVCKIQEQVDTDEILVSNGFREQFRACLGKIEIVDYSQTILDQVTALELNVQVGDTVRVAELKPN